VNASTEARNSPACVAASETACLVGDTWYVAQHWMCDCLPGAPCVSDDDDP